jgi:hypothetical protein
MYQNARQEAASRYSRCMREAPRQRPVGAAVLRTLRGHVKARPSVVFEALDARFRPAESSGALYLASPAAWLIVAQGSWWYRGEYRVVPDASGSNIEHVMLNLASTGWLGAFTGRKVIAEAPAAFATLLRQLRLELE